MVVTRSMTPKKADGDTATETSKQKYPYMPDTSKGMVYEAYKMGVPHYWNWCMETTYPARVKLHYFSPDTVVGRFMNLCSKVPWYMIVIVWLPIMIWELCAGLGFGDVAQGVPVYEQYMNLLKFLLFSEPYHFEAAAPRDADSSVVWMWFALGNLYFTFMEWTIHKYLFHREPKSRVANGLHFILHGSHHVTPLDELRLVFPPVPLSILRALFYSPLVYMVTRDKYEFHAMDAGILTAYLCYDLMHYSNHHANIRFLKPIKRHHLRHHFHGPNEEPCNFALSYLAMIWDFVFQTGCPPRSQATGDAAKLDSTGNKLD